MIEPAGSSSEVDQGGSSPRVEEGATAPSGGDADLAFAGLARHAELVRDGKVSSRELVELFLERIARLEPRLNAYRVVRAERALAEADEADARRATGDERLLLGVPVAIKDDTDVAGEVTAIGTRAHGEPASADAEVVRRLRGAGALVIGKTHVPELVIWPFTESTTWGMTRNPWDLGRTPGGSSGGSAAAVAAGLASAALGSDGAGSIRIPAACCGLFGMKPQRDRISLAPHDDRHHGWHGMATYGPIARSARDAGLFMDATAERREGGTFAEAAGRQPRKLRVALSFAIPPGIVALLASLDGAVREAVERIADLLRSLGHEVVEHDPDYGQIANNVVARYLRGIHDAAETMARPRALERRTRGVARIGGLIPLRALERELRLEAARSARVNGLFERYDVLLTPVATPPPPEIGRWEGRGALQTLLGVVATYGAYTPPWNATGQPAASVPAGFTPEGLPLAAQLVARQNDETTLISLAAQLEAESPWAQRRPPLC